MDLVKIASLHTGSCARPRAPSEPELALGRIGERGLVSAPCGGVRDDSENGPRVPRGPPPTHESTQRPPCRLLAQVVSDRAVPAAPAPQNTGRMLRPTGVRSAHPSAEQGNVPAGDLSCCLGDRKTRSTAGRSKSFEMLPFSWEELGRFGDSKGGSGSSWSSPAPGWKLRRKELHAGGAEAREGGRERPGGQRRSAVDGGRPASRPAREVHNLVSWPCPQGLTASAQLCYLVGTP